MAWAGGDSLFTVQASNWSAQGKISCRGAANIYLFLHAYLAMQWVGKVRKAGRWHMSCGNGPAHGTARHNVVKNVRVNHHATTAASSFWSDTIQGYITYTLGS